jgi:hypothetical protein
MEGPAVLEVRVDLVDGEARADDTKVALVVPVVPVVLVALEVLAARAAVGS